MIPLKAYFHFLQHTPKIPIIIINTNSYWSDGANIAEKTQSKSNTTFVLGSIESFLSLNQSII